MEGELGIRFVAIPDPLALGGYSFSDEAALGSLIERQERFE